MGGGERPRNRSNFNVNSLLMSGCYYHLMGKVERGICGIAFLRGCFCDVGCLNIGLKVSRLEIIYRILGKYNRNEKCKTLNTYLSKKITKAVDGVS